MKVRTTIALERDVLRRAKIAAAATDRTLSRLIEDSLRREIDRETEAEPVRPFKLRVFEGELGLAPGIHQDDFLSPWELIAQLERESETPGDVSP